jgi:DNA-binding transcriptional ArsR family regulator
VRPVIAHDPPVLFEYTWEAGVLRDAGLVEVRQDAQRRVYRLRPAPPAEARALARPYRCP